MFEAISPRYDLLNRLLSAGIDRRWRRAAVALLAPAPGERILDLATGTADVPVALLRCQGDLRVVGVDLTPGMLALGRRKLARLGLSSRGLLVAGDACSLPLAGGSFDGALVAFGVRNVASPVAALAELRRVVRPGGRLVVLEFSTPPGPLGRLFGLYFARVLPRVGAWVSGHPAAYAYLPGSVARFPPPREFAGLMEGAGFSGLRVRALTGGIAHLYRGERP